MSKVHRQPFNNLLADMHKKVDEMSCAGCIQGAEGHQGARIRYSTRLSDQPQDARSAKGCSSLDGPLRSPWSP
jgi:hypothetical protein